ncbi:MAG: hypothetical protein IPM39_29355 [Chloroflexi bacterium]|nr:hypothetical protein [Chloroflexota bacterium]
MKADDNYITPLMFLEDSCFLPYDAGEALRKHINALPNDPEMTAIRKQHAQLVRAFGKTLRQDPIGKKLWPDVRSLCGDEIEKIIYACFLAGVSYGLSPIVTISIYELTIAAVAPVEAAKWDRWQQIEQQIHTLSKDVQAQYALFDRATAEYKSQEQDHAFLQGMRQGQRFSRHITTLLTL